MSGFLEAATLATALGSGLVAGVFFAFSTFVMDALAKLPPPQGIAAMQAINRSAITPLFMAALFGTALAALAVVVADRGERPLLLAGGVLYVLGTIVPTLVRNVPMNDALAAVDPTASTASDRWSRYVDSWTAWNHVRGAAALAAAALLTTALASG